MHLWRAAFVILMAAAALPPCETARAESPPPPAAVAPQPPAATPPAAQPAAIPAAPAKGPAVILSLLPPMPGVFGGKVEFTDKAFPILAECKEIAVQSAIRGTKPLPCRTCGGAGKVNKRELVKPALGVMGKAVLQTWEEECSDCGGYKDVYDTRIGQRLLEVIDRMGHVARDEKFDELRRSAEECLAVANEVRDKMLTTFRCRPVIRSEIHTDTNSATGHISTSTVRTLTGVAMEQGQQKPFHVEVAPMIDPLWTRVGPQSPTGQAVIIIGTTSGKTEAAGWMWMRMKPAGKGPEAIILCGTTQKNVVPEGKVVLGGLMIGRWIPEGSAAATPPAPAGPPVARTPIPTASGPLPPGSLPVILAVVAVEGK
jgi:hypothetical protein